jgi:hypothetical protein
MSEHKLLGANACCVCNPKDSHYATFRGAKQSPFRRPGAFGVLFTADPFDAGAAGFDSLTGRRFRAGGG